MIASTLITIFLWSNLFAPAPYGIALNSETKECGYYWGGDEYAFYYLPNPWETNYGAPIQTDTGMYQWDGDISSIESFCHQIGYTYVPGNIGAERGKLNWTPYAYILFGYKYGPLILVIIIALCALFFFSRWGKKHSNDFPSA
jgi:hypothetical protein